MKRFFVYSIILLSIATSVSADTVATVGFIPNQIWYSKEPLVEGETVKIYTALWNGDAMSASFHVQFYDGVTILGERDVSISPQDVVDVSISWKVTAGDHSISAKISSSTSTTDGKKETIPLTTNTTITDHQFVPVLVKETAKVQVQDQLDKVTTAVKDVVPDSVGSTFSSVDSFRNSTYASIQASQKETQKEISALTQPEQVSSVKDTKNKKNPTIVVNAPAKPLDVTEKPIAYVKLFLLSIVGYIFGSKIVFYGLCLCIVFILIRFIYRKVRNR